MRSGFFTSMAECAFGDWVGIGVLIAIGLFSLTFLALCSAMLVRSLFESSRRKNTSAT